MSTINHNAERDAATADKKLLDFLTDMEQRRTTFHRNTLIACILIAGLALFLCVLDFFVGICAGIVLLFVSLLIFCFRRKAFLDEFKVNVLPKVIKSIDPALAYFPGAGLDEQHFNAIGIYSVPDRYSSEDLLSGAYHKVKVSFAEVHAEEYHQGNDSDSPSYYSDIFRGVVMILDFNKHFNAVTLVKPDVAESTFGALVGNFLQKCGSCFQEGALTRMEDVAFEKRFAVYTEDPVEARYLLSPKLMAKMTDLRDFFGTDMAYVFRDNKLYLTIASQKDFFEMPKKLDISAIQAKHDEFMFFLSIIDALELDNRIWSKK